MLWLEHRIPIWLSFPFWLRAKWYHQGMLDAMGLRRYSHFNGHFLYMSVPSRTHLLKHCKCTKVILCWYAKISNTTSLLSVAPLYCPLKFLNPLLVFPLMEQQRWWCLDIMFLFPKSTSHETSCFDLLVPAIVTVASWCVDIIPDSYAMPYRGKEVLPILVLPYYEWGQIGTT